mgnify:CR=1 FL=1
MPLVTCPKCRIEQIAPKELVGLNWDCPKCGHEFRIGADKRAGSKGFKPSVPLMIGAGVVSLPLFTCCGLGALVMVIGGSNRDNGGFRLTASSDAVALSSNKWFDGAPVDRVESLLNEMMRRGSGMIFVNRQGQYVVVEDIIDGVHPVQLYILAENGSKELERLPGDRKVIILEVGDGRRLNSTEARLLAEDFLRRPSRDELTGKAKKQMDDIIKLGEP